MLKYQVNREFWWKGIKREVGSTVTMAESQAKYLTHVVTPLAPVSAAPAPKAISRKATPLKAAVAEVPINGKRTN
jgi:hypothetical protein